MARERIGVLFVCLGNICRSPMAEGIFRRLVEERGLADRFDIDSAGTGSWHVGEQADPRTREVLSTGGCPEVGRARLVRADDAERFEWILVMDRSNARNVKQVLPASAHDRVRLVLEPTTGGEVPDPYYGGEEGFRLVFRLLDESLGIWLDRMLDAS